MDLSALRSGRRDDVHRPGDLFGQPVVAEGAVVADVHRLGDVGGDEVLVGRVGGLLAGCEWRDEIRAREEPVEPALLGEPGGDLAGGVWGDLQRRLDVVDGDEDDLVTRASESCKESTFSSREALAYILRLFYGTHNCVSYIEYKHRPDLALRLPRTAETSRLNQQNRGVEPCVG